MGDVDQDILFGEMRKLELDVKNTSCIKCGAGSNKSQTICEECSGKEQGYSTKIDYITKLLKTNIANGEKTIVFSQFVGMLDLVSKALKDTGMEYVQCTYI